MILKAKTATTALQPRFNTVIPAARTAVMPTTQTRNVAGTGYSLNQLKSFGLQMGLSPSQINILIDHYQKTGEAPNASNYQRILRDAKGGGLFDLFGIKPIKAAPEITITSPVIDAAIETATNGTGAVMASNTGFNQVSPTEQNFFQKNKSWLIPAAAGVGILGIYLLTKKKK